MEPDIKNQSINLYYGHRPANTIKKDVIWNREETWSHNVSPYFSCQERGSQTEREGMANGTSVLSPFSLLASLAMDMQSMERRRKSSSCFTGIAGWKKEEEAKKMTDGQEEK